MWISRSTCTPENHRLATSMSLCDDLLLDSLEMSVWQRECQEAYLFGLVYHL